MAINIFPAPSTGPEQYNFALRGNDRDITLTMPAGHYSLTARAEGLNAAMNPLTVNGTALPAGQYFQNVSTGSVTVRRAVLTAGMVEQDWVPSGGGNILGGTFGNGTHVLVQDGGIVRISTNANTWTRLSSLDGAVTIRAAVFGNGTFVIGGTGGNIWTSTNASTWTARTFGAGSVVINALAFGNNTFVAATTSGLVRTSPDGVTWTARTGAHGTSSINAITFGNGLFVAVGADGKISTSPDGITWTARTSGTTNVLSGVAFGNGFYIVKGTFISLRSTDAITWTDITSTVVITPAAGSITWNKISFGTAGFIAVGAWVSSARIGFSPDGINWFGQVPSTNNNPLNSSHFGNGVYVSGGNAGYIFAITDSLNNAPVLAYERLSGIQTV